MQLKSTLTHVRPINT